MQSLRLLNPPPKPPETRNAFNCWETESSLKTHCSARSLTNTHCEVKKSVVLFTPHWWRTAVILSYFVSAITNRSSHNCTWQRAHSSSKYTKGKHHNSSTPSISWWLYVTYRWSSFSGTQNWQRLRTLPLYKQFANDPNEVSQAVAASTRASAPITLNPCTHPPRP